MSTWSIQLYTARLNKKIEVMEGKLTDASDQLDILEIGAESLGEIWQGQAYEEWRRELARCILAGRAWIVEMRTLISFVRTAAEKLIATEQKNRQIIEELRV